MLDSETGNGTEVLCLLSQSRNNERKPPGRGRFPRECPNFCASLRVKVDGAGILQRRDSANFTPPIADVNGFYALVENRKRETENHKLTELQEKLRAVPSGKQIVRAS